MITKYHAKYYANLLTQKAVGGELSSISQSLMSASVDINPHQIDAALFAFKSPLSKGIVLADEVGLGKTIEAGLVICQYWAIGKRKIIIVCPAALRKQWSTELIDKFGIDNIILDTKNYNEAIKNGRSPYSKNKAIICSYNFVARKKDEILMHGFDISIIDEAHKLRNVYRQSSKTSHAVRDALTTTKKLLLTATPFQNSLLELYGLTSIIDDHIFGSEKSFRSEYGSGENNTDLRARLSTMYKRTLRRDVKEYINYTNRLPLTQKFDSTDAEYELYRAISDFLRRNDIYSVPAQQKKLTTMIIRKILASSTFALISTLTNIKSRLEKMLETASMLLFTAEDLIDDDEEIDLYVDENRDLLPSLWVDSKFSAVVNGTNLLTKMFGDSGRFPFPKSLYTVEEAIEAGTFDDKQAIVLDYFAGSGTTGHAVIDLNRKTNGNRKYILVEMGEYFELVTKTRVKKAIYSSEWDSGKPTEHNKGISQIMKYMRLESYEDALSNITLEEKGSFFGSNLGGEYLIGYMLDMESKGSLLNLEAFITPFEYNMKITEKNECKERQVDVVETFNYLIGLSVHSQSSISYFSTKEAVNPPYEGAVDLQKDQNGIYSFRQIEGTLPDGRKALIIWRNINQDNILTSNAALDAYFSKYRINPADREFDVIYINGDNNLENLRLDDEQWKVVLIETEFNKRMWEE